MKYVLIFFSMCFLIAGILGIIKIDNLIEGLYVFLLIGIGFVLLLISFTQSIKKVEK